jgi:tetratricopeptide (TPR) repeat protein
MAGNAPFSVPTTELKSPHATGAAMSINLETLQRLFRMPSAAPGADGLDLDMLLKGVAENPGEAPLASLGGFAQPLGVLGVVSPTTIEALRDVLMEALRGAGSTTSTGPADVPNLLKDLGIPVPLQSFIQKFDLFMADGELSPKELQLLAKDAELLGKLFPQLKPALDKLIAKLAAGDVASEDVTKALKDAWDDNGTQTKPTRPAPETGVEPTPAPPTTGTSPTTTPDGTPVGVDPKPETQTSPAPHVSPPITTKTPAGLPVTSPSTFLDKEYPTTIATAEKDAANYLKDNKDVADAYAQKAKLDPNLTAKDYAMWHFVTEGEMQGKKWGQSADAVKRAVGHAEKAASDMDAAGVKLPATGVPVKTGSTAIGDWVELPKTDKETTQRRINDAAQAYLKQYPDAQEAFDAAKKADPKTDATEFAVRHFSQNAEFDTRTGSARRVWGETTPNTTTGGVNSKDWPFIQEGLNKRDYLVNKADFLSSPEGITYMASMGTTYGNMNGRYDAAVRHTSPSGSLSPEKREAVTKDAQAYLAKNADAQALYDAAKKVNPNLNATDFAMAHYSEVGQRDHRAWGNSWEGEGGAAWGLGMSGIADANEAYFNSLKKAAPTTPAPGTIKTAAPVTEPVGGTPTPDIIRQADQKTRGDVKQLSGTLARCVEDGWIDQGTGNNFRRRLDAIEAALAKTDVIGPDLQKTIDQFAGDFFRAEFGSAGHTDGAKVTKTLKTTLDDLVKQNLVTPQEATSLRQRIEALGGEVSGGVDGDWVTRASSIRRELVDTARRNYAARKG